MCKPAGPRDMAAKLAYVEGNGTGRTCIVPPEGDAFCTMRDLWKSDRMPDPADAVVASHAPADGRSKFFFAKDKRLPENRAMANLEKWLGNARARRA